MGSGASQNLEEAQKVVRDLESVIACTSLLMGLNPRYIRFPDMYSIFDFEIRDGGVEDDQSSEALAELKKELQLAMGDQGEGKKQDGTDTDGELQVRDGDEMPTNSGGAGSKDDENDNGMFVFKGTVSPNTKINNGNEPRERKVVEPAIVVAVPEVGLVKLKTLNEQNEDGWTPLHACCHSIDMLEAAKALIYAIQRKNLSIDLKTTKGPGAFASGYTPLHIAAAYGIYDTTKALIDAGAKINTRNSLDQTPLHEVCYRGYTEIAVLLIHATDNLNIECPSGDAAPSHPLTPLAKSCRYGHGRIVKVLLTSGANIDFQDSEAGWTALMEAAYFFHDDIVRLLLANGASPNLLSKEGYSAKEICSSRSIRDMLEDYDKFRIKFMEDNGGADGRTIGSEWVVSSGARELQKMSDEKKKRNIFGSDWDDEMSFGEEYDSFKDFVNNSVDVFQDSTFHINGAVGDDANTTNVDNTEGTKTTENNETPETPSATLVGMTNKSEHRLLGDLPALDLSPNGNRRLQNLKDEHAIEEWRKKRKQELIERAAKVAAKKRQKERRRQRRQYKEAIETSDSIPAEFICPLTMRLMKRPVTTPYGQTYEAAAILEYIQDYQNRCPKTGQPLARVDLKKDERLMKKISKWKKEFKKEYKKSISPKNKQQKASTEGTKTVDESDGGDLDRNGNSGEGSTHKPSIISKKIQSPKTDVEILESSKEIKFHSSPKNAEAKFDDEANKYKSKHFQHLEEDDDEYDFD